jgi:hypothetical protein
MRRRQQQHAQHPLAACVSKMESSAHHRAASFRNGSVAWLPPRRVLLRWQQQRLFGREKQAAQLQQEPGVRQGLH